MIGEHLGLVVYGHPRTQGSKVRTRYGMRDANADVLLPWRNKIELAARDELGEPVPRFRGPVVLVAHFYFLRPKAHYRSGRFSHQLREGAPTHPVGRGYGDLDKQVRALCDALTDAGVWIDDSQVAELRAGKRYCSPTEAMQGEGVVLEVYREPPSALDPRLAVDPP